MLDVFYDGFRLTEYFTVRRIQPSLSAPVNNNFLGMNHLSGANFKYSTLGQIKIDIEITIKDDVRRSLDELNRILFTREPKRLVISDTPERFLLCKLDGEVKFNSRFIASDATLSFISPNHYWEPTEDDKKFYMDAETGRILLDNGGTAPTQPAFNVEFTSDCGYLGLVSPNGFITLGNPKELDAIALPKTEFALNEEMHNLTGWTRLNNVENQITDYMKITSRGQAKFDEFGTLVDKTTFTGIADHWQGHAYTKPFNQGQVDRVADNFKLRSRLVMQDLSGKRTNTGALLIVILDTDNKPIMTTSIYDVSSDKNQLSTSFKVNSFKAGDPNHSTIIHTGSLAGMNGFIDMEKSGNRFSWLIHTDSVTTTPIELKTGDYVHLKSSATHAETGHRIRADYKGRTYRIGASKMSNGRLTYRLDIDQWPIYWIYATDIVEYGRTTANQQQKQIRHTITNNNLAQMNPAKVLIWQGVWGAGNPYSKFSLNSVVINRLYSTNSRDIENLFRPGDTLYINNETGDILHNGSTFQGFKDYDSRFFDIDYGGTEIQVIKSDWASLPMVSATVKERYL